MNQDGLDALEKSFRRAGFSQAQTNFAVAVIRNNVEPVIQKRDAALSLLKEASGPMSYGHWSSEFRGRVEKSLEGMK